MSHTTTLDTLIDAFLGLWNEEDAATRRASIEQVWAENAHFVDPAQSATGRDELDALIAGFHTTFPGHRCVRTTPAESGNVFRWNLVSPTGDTMVIGEDTMQVNDAGQIESVTGTFVEA